MFDNIWESQQQEIRENEILEKRSLAKNEILETEVWQNLEIAKTRNPEKAKSRETMFDNIWESQQQEIRKNEILEKRSLTTSGHHKNTKPGNNEILENEFGRKLPCPANSQHPDTWTLRTLQNQIRRHTWTSQEAVGPRTAKPNIPKSEKAPSPKFC